jgi:hypothetical protein
LVLAGEKPWTNACGKVSLALLPHQAFLLLLV